MRGVLRVAKREKGAREDDAAALEPEARVKLYSSKGWLSTDDAVADFPFAL